MSTNAIEAGHLTAFIERIERLEEDKKTVADEIKDVYTEAKGTGYDIKVIRKIVSIRKQDKDKRPRGGRDPRPLHAGARA